jgi:hypothetical protein
MLEISELCPQYRKFIVMTAEDGTDGLTRNVGRELPRYTV